MSFEFTCQRCNKTKIAQNRGPREFCSACLRVITQRKAYLTSTTITIKPRDWQKFSKENILQDLDWFVRRCNDIGTSGDITVCTPEHPMFEQIARKCTHIEEIA